MNAIETYYDAVPRSAARVEEIGPFTLFVGTGAWPYYARPRLGVVHEFTPVEIETVRARQRELGVPEAFEWVDETTPSLLPAARAAGLEVMEAPLMVLSGAVPAAVPDGVTVRTIDADDRALPAAVVAQDRGFGGTGEGTDGRADFLRERLRAGLTRMAIAESAEGVLAAGQHQPVGDVTEIVGVATVPEARRRGLAGAVTAQLVADATALVAAARRADSAASGTAGPVVFLSAGEDAARVYARLGFERRGTACIVG
ncbi:GNAT family N-acetyltransferase [Solirubrobacter phytolaccae]|uniref:GNAT family N-acetyltransferase n=1 Tax=Solirubrobacter phytolaccae TaxID=1404360 RepID=A0A9X3N497_9ACTN|nr:GNAT family N-acetyltransferase [Solirubrobacter phytolaccae]MDA0179221.1 GNAT family N-acetyltransferase [Solirubrobacter phytolaccae]